MLVDRSGLSLPSSLSFHKPAASTALVAGGMHVQRRDGFAPVGLSNWAVNGFIGAMEDSPALELTVLDYGSMVLPRTYLEWRQRGNDMARETLIREVTGNISIVFLAGWLGLAATSLYNHLPFFNPKGLDGKAFINLDNYRGMVGLTQQVLHEQQDKLASMTPQELRSQVARRLVSALDDDFKHGVPNALKDLPESVTSVNATTREEALTKLANILSMAGKKPHEGGYAIEELIAEAGPKDAKAAKQLRKQFRRIAHEAEKRLTTKFEPLKQAIGWTSTVNFNAVQPHAPKEALSLEGRSLNELLLQMKRYFEHGFDRVVADVSRQNKQPVDFSKSLGELVGAESGDRVLKTLEGELVGESRAWYQVGQYIPKATDSLLKAMEKQKLWVTGTTLLASTLMAVGFTFMDAYITKRVHGGVTYFPGDQPDGLPPEATKPAKSKPKKTDEQSAQPGADSAAASQAMPPALNQKVAHPFVPQPRPFPAAQQPNQFFSPAKPQHAYTGQRPFIPVYSSDASRRRSPQPALATGGPNS